MTCLDGLPCFCKDVTTLGHLPSMHVDADELDLGICPTPLPHYLCCQYLSMSSDGFLINEWFTNDDVVICISDRAIGVWLSIKYVHIGIDLIQSGITSCTNSHNLLQPVVGF